MFRLLLSFLVTVLFAGKRRQNIEQNTQQLAKDIWTLCGLAWPKMSSLQGRFLNRGFHTEEFKEYRRITDGLVLIHIFGVQMDHPEELEWMGLNYFWMEVRDLVAKYIEKHEEWRILNIDEQCEVYCRLPEIVLGEYLLKAQPAPKANLKPYEKCSPETIGDNWWKSENEVREISYGVISGTNFSFRS